MLELVLTLTCVFFILPITPAFEALELLNLADVWLVYAIGTGINVEWKNDVDRKDLVLYWKDCEHS